MWRITQGNSVHTINLTATRMRTAISSSQSQQKVILNDIVKENLVEVHRNSLLLVGVRNLTTSVMAYLFNLNIDHTFLAY